MSTHGESAESSVVDIERLAQIMDVLIEPTTDGREIC
jgi:hypothetical protein